MAARCALPGVALAPWLSFRVWGCSGARRPWRMNPAPRRSTWQSTIRRTARPCLVLSTRSAFRAPLHRWARSSGRTSEGPTVSGRFPLGSARCAPGPGALAPWLRTGIALVSLWFRLVRCYLPLVRGCSLLVRCLFGVVRGLFAGCSLVVRHLVATCRLLHAYLSPSYRRHAIAFLASEAKKAPPAVPACLGD